MKVKKEWGGKNSAEKEKEKKSLSEMQQERQSNIYWVCPTEC